MSDVKVAYTITKTGTDTYEMIYRVINVRQGVQQVQKLTLTNEDSDGSLKVQSSNVGPTSIASYASSGNAMPSGTIYRNDIPMVNGFPVNVDSGNLQPGGAYFSIESFTTV